MRLFVAVDLDEAVRAQLSALLRELRGAASDDIKWVAPESMHLTLKFIGEQPEARLAELTEALNVIPRTGPVPLRFRGLGCFPNERRPRVFWAGVEAPPNWPGWLRRLTSRLTDLASSESAGPSRLT